jgi:hypothetical protein
MNGAARGLDEGVKDHVSSLVFGIDEPALNGLVRDRPAKIDFGFGDLSIVNRQDFGIAKAPAGCALTLRR